MSEPASCGVTVDVFDVAEADLALGFGVMGLKGQLHNDGLVIRHTCVTHLEVGDDRMRDNQSNVGRGLNSLAATGNQRQRQDGLLTWVLKSPSITIIPYHRHKLVVGRTGHIYVQGDTWVVPGLSQTHDI